MAEQREVIFRVKIDVPASLKEIEKTFKEIQKAAADAQRAGEAFAYTVRVMGNFAAQAAPALNRLAESLAHVGVNLESIAELYEDHKGMEKFFKAFSQGVLNYAKAFDLIARNAKKTKDIKKAFVESLEAGIKTMEKHAGKMDEIGNKFSKFAAAVLDSVTAVRGLSAQIIGLKTNLEQLDMVLEKVVGKIEKLKEVEVIAGKRDFAALGLGGWFAGGAAEGRTFWERISSSFALKKTAFAVGRVAGAVAYPFTVLKSRFAGLSARDAIGGALAGVYFGLKTVWRGIALSLKLGAKAVKASADLAGKTVKTALLGLAGAIKASTVGYMRTLGGMARAGAVWFARFAFPPLMMTAAFEFTTRAFRGIFAPLLMVSELGENLSQMIQQIYAAYGALQVSLGRYAYAKIQAVTEGVPAELVTIASEYAKAMNVPFQMVYSELVKAYEESGNIEIAIRDLKARIRAAWEALTPSEREAMVIMEKIGRMNEVYGKAFFETMIQLYRQRGQTPEEALKSLTEGYKVQAEVSARLMIIVIETMKQLLPFFKAMTDILMTFGEYTQRAMAFLQTGNVRIIEEFFDRIFAQTVGALKSAAVKANTVLSNVGTLFTETWAKLVLPVVTSALSIVAPAAAGAIQQIEGADVGSKYASMVVKVLREGILRGIVMAFGAKEGAVIVAKIQAAVQMFMKGMAGPLWKSITDALIWLLRGIGAIFKVIGGVLETLWRGFLVFMFNTLKDLPGAIGGIIKSIKENWPKIVEALKNIFFGIVGWLWTGFIKAVKDVFGPAKAEVVKEEAKKFFNKVVEALGKALNALGVFFKYFLDIIGKVEAGLFKVVAFIADKLAGFLDFLAKLPGLGFLHGWAESLRGAAGFLGKAAENAWNFGKVVEQAWAGFVAKMRQMGKEGEAKYKEESEDYEKRVKAGSKALEESLKKLSQSIKDKFSLDIESTVSDIQTSLDDLKSAIAGIGDPASKAKDALSSLASSIGNVAKTASEARYWFGTWLATRTPPSIKVAGEELPLASAIKRLQQGFLVVVGERKYTFGEYARLAARQAGIETLGASALGPALPAPGTFKVKLTMTTEEARGVLGLFGQFKVFDLLAEAGIKLAALAEALESLGLASDDAVAKLKDFATTIGQVAGDVFSSLIAGQRDYLEKVGEYIAKHKEKVKSTAVKVGKAVYEIGIKEEELKLYQYVRRGQYGQAALAAFSLFMKTGKEKFLEMAETFAGLWENIMNRYYSSAKKAQLAEDMLARARAQGALTVAKALGKANDQVSALIQLFNLTGNIKYATEAYGLLYDALKETAVMSEARARAEKYQVKELERRYSIALAAGRYSEAYRTALQLAEMLGSEKWLMLADSLKALADASDEAEDAIKRLSDEMSRFSALRSAVSSFASALGKGAYALAQAYQSLARWAKSPDERKKYAEEAEKQLRIAETEEKKKLERAKRLLASVGAYTAPPTVKAPASLSGVIGTLASVERFYVETGLGEALAFRAASLRRTLSMQMTAVSNEAAKWAVKVADRWVKYFGFYFATRAEQAIEAGAIASAWSKVASAFSASALDALKTLQGLIDEAVQLGLTGALDPLLKAFIDVQNAFLNSKEALAEVMEGAAEVLKEKAEDFAKLGAAAIAKIRAPGFSLSFENFFGSVQGLINTLDELIGWARALGVDVSELKRSKDELVDKFGESKNDLAKAFSDFGKGVADAVKHLLGKKGLLGVLAATGLRGPEVPASRLEAFGTAISTIGEVVKFAGIASMLDLKANVQGLIDELFGLAKEELPAVLSEFEAKIRAFVEAAKEMIRDFPDADKWREVASILQGLAPKGPAGPLEKALRLFNVIQNLERLKALFMTLGRVDLAAAVAAKIEELKAKYGAAIETLAEWTFKVLDNLTLSEEGFLGIIDETSGSFKRLSDVMADVEAKVAGVTVKLSELSNAVSMLALPAVDRLGEGWLKVAQAVGAVEEVIAKAKAGDKEAEKARRVLSELVKERYGTTLEAWLTEMKKAEEAGKALWAAEGRVEWENYAVPTKQEASLAGALMAWGRTIRTRFGYVTAFAGALSGLATAVMRFDVAGIVTGVAEVLQRGGELVLHGAEIIKTAGNLFNKAASFVGKLFGQAVEDFSDVVNAYFVPAVLTFVESVIGKSGVEAIGGIVRGVVSWVGGAAGALGGIVGPVASFLTNIAGALGPIIASVVPVVTQLAVPVALAAALPFVGVAAKMLLGALGLQLATPGLDAFFAAMGNLIKSLVDVLAALWNVLKPFVTGLLIIVTAVADFFGSILAPIINVIATLFGWLAQILNAVANALSPVVELFMLFGGIIMTIGKMLGAVIGWLANLVMGLLKPLVDFIVAVINFIGSLIKMVVDAIMSVLGWLVPRSESQSGGESKSISVNIHMENVTMSGPEDAEELGISISSKLLEEKWTY